MHFTWFDLNWSWIGLAISAVLLLFLFATNIFRSQPNISRWRDPVWLAWLAPAAYMPHQWEEYGIDLMGRAFYFPTHMCLTMQHQAYPACTVPEATYVGINVTIIWGAGLVCALLSRRLPLVGLSIYAIHSTNSLSHLGALIFQGAYNPGVLTSALIQLPLSIWVAYAMYSNSAIRKSGLATLFLAGVLFSAVLLGSLQLFSRGVISGDVLVTIQYLNPALMIFVIWLKERWNHSVQPQTA